MQPVAWKPSGSRSVLQKIHPRAEAKAVADSGQGTELISGSLAIVSLSDFFSYGHEH